MQTLSANLSVLPEQQRRLWPRLHTTPAHFVLYGGTALALQLGHRQSIDFDFFSSEKFEPLVLARSVDYLARQPIVQQDALTLSCNVVTASGTVKISFFGGLKLGQINRPNRFDDNQLAVASLLDVFGMKCATVPQRNEAKDYLDIHALISQSALTLSDGIAGAQAIYGPQYNPLLTLQALTHFDDLDHPVPAAIQSDLRRAVRAVALDQLPVLSAKHRIGSSEQEDVS